MVIHRWLRRYWRVVCVTLLIVAVQQHYFGQSAKSPFAKSPFTKNEKREFHFITSATTSNAYLCRLLVSAVATNYPPPTILMWGDEEQANPYKNHMNKVEAILNHLNTFNADQDDDLVLVLDGYDIWLQLGPDIVIRRYHEIIAAENRRLEKRLGWRAMFKSQTYNSVVFGPDKICWPEDASRTACWAAPDSPLPRYAFGPETDSGQWRENFRPRWLNSGTIIGPVKDVRNIVSTTLNLINQNRTIDSDQFYFATVWGEQEYHRRQVAGESTPEPFEIWFQDEFTQEGHYKLIEPKTPPRETNDKSELHITIDYWSRIFQTNAFYYPFLTWSDIDESHPNLEELGDLANASLLVNIATNQVPALMHFTPPKDVQQPWWPRMWFFPHAREIIYGPNTGRGFITTANGIDWWAHVPYDPVNVSAYLQGGAFPVGSSGRYLSWPALCYDYENVVFYNRDS